MNTSKREILVYVYTKIHVQSNTVHKNKKKIAVNNKMDK